MKRARVVAVRVVSLALAAAAAAWALSVFGAVYVGGASMSPALAKGDLAVFRKSSAGVDIGDIVLVEKPGWTSGVLHRVIAVGFDDTLQLQGDANPVPDFDPVPMSSVRGVVALVVPSGRLLAVVEGLLRMVQSRVT